MLYDDDDVFFFSSLLIYFTAPEAEQESAQPYRFISDVTVNSARIIQIFILSLSIHFYSFWAVVCFYPLHIYGWEKK
jgi:hypothetical protein